MKRRKLHLPRILWGGVFLLFLMNGCRTEDAVEVTETAISIDEPIRISAFTKFDENIFQSTIPHGRDDISVKGVGAPKGGETGLSYQKPFRKIVQYYLERYPEYAELLESKHIYLQLNVSTQTFGEEQKAIFFPATDSLGKVVGVWAGAINADRDFARFQFLDRSIALAVPAIEAFEDYYRTKAEAKAERRHMVTPRQGQSDAEREQQQTIEELVMVKHTGIPKNSDVEQLIDHEYTPTIYLDDPLPSIYGDGNEYNPPKENYQPRDPKEDEDSEIAAHIDASALKNNKCAKAVYDKLKSKPGLFSELLKSFKGTSIVNLEFKFDNNGTNKKTPVGVNNLDKLYYYGLATISLNSDVMGSSDLLIASVFIHEMLHAQIAYNLVKAGWDGNRYKDLKKIDKSNLPGILDEYHKYDFNANFADHNYIANWYKDRIANALAQYDNHQHSTEFYENVALTGLSESKYYEDLPEDKQNAISKLYYDNLLKQSSCTK